MPSLPTAVIGYGYWGKNLARVFARSHDFNLTTIVDSSPEARNLAKHHYPHVRIVASVEEMNPDTAVVVLATPVSTHYQLAKKSLLDGKHVLLTKPATPSYGETAELFQIADSKGTTLFIDHTFVFNPAVKAIKDLLPRIGEPYFWSSQRLNLGTYQADISVVHDLMPHDLSILCFLFPGTLAWSQGTAFQAAKLPQADTASINFKMTNGLRGTSSISWLAPSKIRQILIVGSQGMIVYDDVAVSEKVKLYDKGISLKDITDVSSLQSYTARISYRAGDMYSPAIPNYEALEEEVKEFKRAIESSERREYYNTLNLNITKSLDTITNTLSSE